MPKDITAILKNLYPLVSKNITPQFLINYKKLMTEFIESRSQSLYDTAPCDRIYFTEEDAEQLFKAINISKREVTEALSKTYYWKIASFNPKAAKDEFTVLLLCILRYFYLAKRTTELELSLIHLSFSGKFYPSIHYGSYPKVQPSENRHIMDYVVNNELSNKFDIKRHGSIINSVKSVGLTWLDSYGSRIKDFDDEDIVYLIQQLHNRIKSFTINIAEVYYKIYENKDRYITYDSDDLSDENYRLADNDSLRIERYVESTLNQLTSSSIDPKLCRIAANNNIRLEELKSILETILEDNTNVPVIKELIRILVTEYFLISKDKDPSNINFISTSIAAKPNSKNPNVHKMNQILENWLDENSPSYRKRKSRLATKLSYHKAVLSYFVLVTHKAAKGIR